jgi:hypothetical protein
MSTSKKVGRNMAESQLQDRPRMMNEWNPVRLIWHSRSHILIYPLRGRVSIKRRPTIIPCLSETETRAQNGKDQRQGETFACVRAIFGPIVGSSRACKLSLELIKLAFLGCRMILTMAECVNRTGGVRFLVPERVPCLRAWPKEGR